MRGDSAHFSQGFTLRRAIGDVSTHRQDAEIAWHQTPRGKSR